MTVTMEIKKFVAGQMVPLPLSDSGQAIPTGSPFFWPPGVFGPFHGKYLDLSTHRGYFMIFAFDTANIEHDGEYHCCVDPANPNAMDIVQAIMIQSMWGVTDNALTNAQLLNMVRLRSLIVQCGNAAAFAAWYAGSGIAAGSRCRRIPLTLTERRGSSRGPMSRHGRGNCRHGTGARNWFSGKVLNPRATFT